MLQSIRDRTQNWITAVIIGLVCVAFVLWGIHSYVASSGASEVVAKVNGQAISQSDLNVAYERLRQQRQTELGADYIIGAKVEANLKREALDQLIMSSLLAKVATNNNFRVSLSEVERALLSIPAFQINGQFSRDRFNEVLSGLLYNQNTFLAEMKNTMLINQVRSGFVDSAFSLPNEVDTAVSLVNQKRDIGYLIIPASRFVKQANVTDIEAQAYYQQNQAEFTTPEQASFQYIELSLPKIEATLHFTTDQLKQFYQNNLSSFTQPIRWHVAHILIKTPDNATAEDFVAAKAKADVLIVQLQKGADFSALAKENSEDKASARQGGVLNWFSPGVLDPNFEKAVSTLQVGQISAPIQTNNGIEIVKLLAVQPPAVQPFDKVQDQVKKALTAQQAQQIFAEAADKLSNLTYANPSSLEPAAKALGLAIQTTGLFNREGGKEELTHNPKLLAQAFSTDVLQGNNSDIIELGPSREVVLHLHQHVPAMQIPFATAKVSIEEKLKKQAAIVAAQREGDKLLTALTRGEKGSLVAKQAGVTWNAVSDLGRYSNTVPMFLVEAAFRLPHPQPGQSSAAGVTLPNGDYALIQLNSVKNGVLGKVAAIEHRVYREQLERNLGQLDYVLYVHGVVHQAKVKMSNPDQNEKGA